MPMNLSFRRPRLTRMFALAMVAVLIGGCVTTAPRTAANAGQRDLHPLVAQADALVRAGAGQEQIDALLAQLDNDRLARDAAVLAVGDPLYNHLARALLSRGLPLPRPLDRQPWQFTAGDRPTADRDGYRPPVKLAVLLPLTGEMAPVAASVRDGFLTGYYGESRRRPEVSFHDTHGSAGGALSAYDQAVAAGSDFIVGPLAREAVDAVLGRGALPVPVLALNHGRVAPPPGNVSFSLSPEDEGTAAADRLVAEGARRVLVIAAGDDSPRRSVEALRKRLAELGGTVTDVVTPAVSDFSAYTGTDGGVDAVFLAVRGNVARELMPRLALAGLAGKPRVATSQLGTGTGKPEDDNILDGIAFPSEPWTSRGYVPGMPSAENAAATVPTARGAAARLFAFGHDAWLLTAYLERLAQAPDAHVAGATGLLQVDGTGHVRRIPAWSTFRGGVVSQLADAIKH